MQRIVLASSNQGKIREIQHFLTPLHIELISQKELNIIDVPETGLSFVENAILKARNAAEHSGLAAIADDAGLEVDFLNGAPGIYSARYAGPHASDQDNINKLLQAMKNTSPSQRRARFQCVIVSLRHPADPTPIICQGSWEGEILLEPRGNGGFGYDPVFFVPSHQCSAAELTLDQKNKISHRAIALEKLVSIYNPTRHSRTTTA